jgi:hypothetical protein
MPRLHRLIGEAVAYIFCGVCLIIPALIIGNSSSLATSLLISFGSGIGLLAVPKFIDIMWLLRDRAPVENPGAYAAVQIGAPVRIVVFGVVGALTAGTAADIYKFAPQTFPRFNGGVYLLIILGGLIFFADAVLKDVQAGKRTAGVVGALAMLLLFYAMFPNMPDDYKPSMIAGIVQAVKYGLYLWLLSLWFDKAERARESRSRDEAPTVNTE